MWIYGKHAVLAALANSSRKLNKLFVTSEARVQLADQLRTADRLRASKVEPIVTTFKHLDSLLGEDAVHQGIALETNSIFVHGLSSLPSSVLASKRSTLLLLDHLTDPQNVGNIVRSANAFGVDAVLTTKDHSFSETPALAKAACGALDRIRVVLVTNLASTIKSLKDAGYWVVGLDSGTTQCLHGFKFPEKTVLVLGAEGEGLRDLTKKNCDFLVRIEMQSGVDSINASSAAAIAMYRAMVG